MPFRIPLVLNNGELEQVQDGDILDVRAATYSCEQLVPSACWTIRHNLDRFPDIRIVDSAGQLCFGDVYYLDSNTIQVRFNAGFSGTAYIS